MYANSLSQERSDNPVKITYVILTHCKIYTNTCAESNLLYNGLKQLSLSPRGIHMKKFEAVKRNGRSKDMKWRVHFQELVMFDGELTTIKAVGFGATKEAAISDCMTHIAFRVANMANKKFDSPSLPPALRENA